MSQPYFGQVWGWSPTFGKSWDLESSGIPECSELDSKGQNTSHWGVLGVIRKVLKRGYRKWPHTGHSDICSPSYEQKKGRESKFDSRPLKVGNRPLPDVRFGSATWRWKYLDERYNFGLDVVVIQLRSRELWQFKVPGVPPGQFRDKFKIDKMKGAWFLSRDKCDQFNHNFMNIQRCVLCILKGIVEYTKIYKCAFWMYMNGHMPCVFKDYY